MEGRKMTEPNRKLLAQTATVLLVAASLKYFYSVATVEQLVWLLGPTAKGVELVTGARFTYEAFSGYLNTERNFLIAPVCAGMNFLITAFLLLSFLSLWHNRSEGARWRSLLTGLSAAYVTTIIANTVRIASAVSAQGTSAGNPWFDREQIHRIEGITVYFGFLLALFFISESLRRNKRSVGSERGGALTGLLIPLLVYYAVTLGVPVLNGAFARGNGFREHTLFVLVIPVILLVPFAVYRSAAFAYQRLRTG
jgi:exosortase K